MSSMARVLPLSPKPPSPHQTVRCVQTASCRKSLSSDNDGDHWSLWNNKWSRFFFFLALPRSVCRCSSVPEFLDLIFLWSAIEVVRRQACALKSRSTPYNSAQMGSDEGGEPSQSWTKERDGTWLTYMNKAKRVNTYVHVIFPFHLKNLKLWVWAVLVRYLV